MAKKLSEMSREELWQLFPIIIKEHNPAYFEWYAEEEARILNLCSKSDIFRINHIGSTTVPGLLSKPTVDILLEITENAAPENIRRVLEADAWTYSPHPENPPPHMMFMKGYTESGFAEKVFHLHVRYPGDWGELYFRDYLKLDPDVAEAYGNLKLELKTKYEHDRDAYTKAKTDFISHHTKTARAEFGNCYSTSSL